MAAACRIYITFEELPVQNIAVGNSIMRFATMHTAKSLDNIAGEQRRAAGPSTAADPGGCKTLLRCMDGKACSGPPWQALQQGRCAGNIALTVLLLKWLCCAVL